MHRRLIPSILASLGYVLVLWATRQPLLEWNISEIVTDFPSSYEVHISPYTVTTRLGEHLDDGSFFGSIYVSKDDKICDLDYLNFNARRSQNASTLERVSIQYFSDKNTIWLLQCIMIGFFLSIIYIWLFTIWHKRPIWDAATSTVLAAIILIFLTQIVRPFLWRVGPSFDYLGDLACYPGTVTFDVTLARIHYEILLILFVGGLAALGALSLMLRQIIKVTIERKAIPR